MVPTFSEQNYTKKKGNITRVSFKLLRRILRHYENPEVIIERPMTNPTRMKAMLSAMRALEVVLSVVEYLGYPMSYIDSKEWQAALLPKGVKGGPELKKASLQIGCRLFPKHKKEIIKHKDADGLLIAEYCRRTR